MSLEARDVDYGDWWVNHAIDAGWLSPDALTHAMHDVIAERERQETVEKFGHENDALYVDGEMAAAAACYTLTGCGWERKMLTPVTMLWPWALSWWKPKDRRRDLVRAAALIVAEIERLDRKGAEWRDGGKDG